MRKIVAGRQVSVDGVMEPPQECHLPYRNDERLKTGYVRENGRQMFASLGTTQSPRR